MRMLDVYLRGDVDRISPEAPVPVVRIREKELALGGAANVAQNVAAIERSATWSALSVRTPKPGGKDDACRAGL